MDEAHKLSATREGKKVQKTQRYQLGEKRASKARHVLLLTATPHKGDDYAYFLLLSLLEPRLFATPEDLKRESQSNQFRFVLRRSKEQVFDLQGRKLFPPREVQTLQVELTEPERELYDRVTDYVRRWYKRVHGLQDSRSRNVAFALMILQRRLSSSLYAVRESLRRRQQKLKDLLDRWDRHLLEQRLGELDSDLQEESGEMPAKEWEKLQEELESLTAAISPEELKAEVSELEELIRLAGEVGKVGQEAKLKHLQDVVEKYLRSNPQEKLLVFTEFKDTLNSLERWFHAWGFAPAIIHGAMNLAQRVEQERYFRDHAQVMVATEAAGEGLNLQFCRLMINYDLPWNPNRLEQRMGRIHRYGQRHKCLIFNLIYSETCEGYILTKLLEKLEVMRHRFGDSIYDVIGTRLENVRLETLIMNAVMTGSTVEWEEVVSDLESRLERYKQSLEENALTYHIPNLEEIREGDRKSAQYKLVPWDVERFTKTAVRLLGGEFEPDKRDPQVYRLNLRQTSLSKTCDFVQRHPHDIRVAFQRNVAQKTRVEFLAPGHPLFEALVNHFLDKRRPLKAILADEKDREGTLWIYRIRLVDGYQMPVKERLLAIFHDHTTGEIRSVDPRMLWDLESLEAELPPLPDLESHLKVGYERACQHARQQLQQLHKEAAAIRQQHFAIKSRWHEECFQKLIEESREKLWEYGVRLAEGQDMKIAIRQEKENLEKLQQEKEQFLQNLRRECDLFTLEPELEAFVLILPKTKLAGSLPLSDEEVKQKVEEIGMRIAMEYERQHGRDPKDVHLEFRGYDIESVSESDRRFIEVKAFATKGEIQISCHELQMAERLREKYWLYVVENTLSQPRLTTIQDPASRLAFEPRLGVVHYVAKFEGKTPPDQSPQASGPNPGGSPKAWEGPSPTTGSKPRA